MKPSTIQLPNGLRDALEQALRPVAAVKDPDERERQAAECVAKLMYPERADSGLTPLHDQLLGLQTGHEAPVLMLGNLPPTQGKLFFLGLFRLFNNHTDYLRQPLDIHATDTIGFHMDEAYELNAGKQIRGLYCEEPGRPPMPTVFLSVEEIIHAHVCAALGKPVDSSIADVRGQQYTQLREAYIKRLEGITVHVSGDGKKQTQAFLQRYDPGKYAVEFSICWPDCRYSDLGKAMPDKGDQDVYHEFMNTAEKLRASAAKGAVAGTIKNTVAIWNNPLVFHDRSGLEKQVQGRKLVSLTARPHYLDSLSAKGAATGAPGAIVDVTTKERDHLQGLGLFGRRR